MPHYLCPRRRDVPFFFAVALARRDSRLLVDRINLLREAVGITGAERSIEMNYLVHFTRTSALYLVSVERAIVIAHQAITITS